KLGGAKDKDLPGTRQRATLRLGDLAVAEGRVRSRMQLREALADVDARLDGPLGNQERWELIDRKVRLEARLREQGEAPAESGKASAEQGETPAESGKASAEQGGTPAESGKA